MLWLTDTEVVRCPVLVLTRRVVAVVDVNRKVEKSLETILMLMQRSGPITAPYLE